MTTIARTLFEDGIYHVYNRGHNHMTLFHEKSDFLFYLRCIKYCREKIEFEIFAICLMTNHYHILIKDIGKNLPLIMDTINSVYARYYNEKYNHKGCIFDGPFESNPILNDYGFTRVYRYIIRNPVAARMTSSIYEYPWVTTIKEKDIFNLVNFDVVDEVFKRICKMSYEEYLKSDVDDLWVDDIEIYRLENNIANEIFNNILHKLTGKEEFDRYSIDDRTKKEIICIAWYRGLTIKQLSKLTAMSKSQIRYLRDKY